MKLSDWIYWVIATMLVFDLLVVGMAARGQFTPKIKEDGVVTVYRHKIESALMEISKACNDAALSQPFNEKELRNLYLMVDKNRAVRMVGQRNAKKVYQTTREVAEDYKSAVTELDKFLCDVETKWPHWKPIRKAVNRLVKLVGDMK